MRLLLALGLVAALAAPLKAQEEPLRYRPLAVGDTWVFNGYWGTADPFATWTPSSVSRYRVLGDTLVGGAEYAVVEAAAVTDGRPERICTAGVAYSASGEPTLVQLEGPSAALACVRPFALPLSPQNVTTHTPGTYPVGTTPYTFSVVRETWETGQTGSGALFERQAFFAIDVGLIASGTVEQVGTNAVAFSSRLAYASVGGVEYGLNPVASEGAPAGPSALALTAAPTPTAGTLTLHLAGADRAAVAVYSATGRRVFAGATVAGALTLDTRAWASGMYVARAVVDGQAVTARVVVAR